MNDSSARCTTAQNGHHKHPRRTGDTEHLQPTYNTFVDIARLSDINGFSFIARALTLYTLCTENAGDVVTTHHIQLPSSIFLLSIPTTLTCRSKVEKALFRFIHVKKIVFVLDLAIVFCKQNSY